METDSPEAKDHVETLRRLNDDCIKSVVHVDERCRLRSAGPGGLARCDGAADEVGYYTGKRRLPGETEQERLGLVRGCNFPPAQTEHSVSITREHQNFPAFRSSMNRAS